MGCTIKAEQLVRDSVLSQVRDNHNNHKDYETPLDFVIEEGLVYGMMWGYWDSFELKPAIRYSRYLTPIKES